MPVDCSSCLVASSSTGVVGVRVCQFRPLLVSRRELVSLRRLSVPLSNFMMFPVTLNDQLWNITAQLREYFKECCLMYDFRQPSHKFLLKETEIMGSFSVSSQNL